MKHQAFDDECQRTALAAAVQSTIFRPLLTATLGVLFACIAGDWLVSWLFDLRGTRRFPLEIASAIAFGGVAALAVSRQLSRAMAAAAIQPVELLLGQLDTRAIDRFNWMSGRALTREELAADVKLLQRRIRQLSYQSRAVVGELEQVRAQTLQQSLAKSQFLANMSHELRTPLNAILGYAMLLQEDASEAGNTSTVADLERIQQAGRNLLGLINNILDLSKIEAGRMDVQRAVIDVEALAKSVAAECGAYEALNGNRFEMIMADGVGIMIGDSEKLAQCLSNLLRNAFKFTRNGSIALTVSPVHRQDAPSVEFAVSDNGPGIDSEHIDGLFDAFQSIHDGGGRQGASPGLGLTIVQRLAAMMGGDCTVESKVGEGSTFRLVVPLGDPPERAGLTLAPRAEAETNFVETPCAQHTVLIVEDDAATLDLMHRWLARMGYSIFSTCSGASALTLAREHKPDLILLDALLPERSGYDILEEICADPEVGHIPTILITVDDDRARGLRAGAADYLQKPITEEQLRAALDVYRQPAAGDILLIEDDDASADLLRRSVAQAGFSARRAVNGAEGLAMATEVRPQAIVLDLAMPAMNGFEVLDRLAEDDELRGVPLIVVSGCDITIEDHRRLAAAGHRFFMKAACTPREIAQSLKELVA